MLPPWPALDEIEICIMCVSSLEADAVCSLFDETYDRPGSSTGKPTPSQNINPKYNDYIMGRIADHNVVLARMPGKGVVYSAGESRRLKERFKGIKLVLLVGICGAIPERPDGQEIMLGDVVVSKAVVRYDLAKQYPLGIQWTDVSYTMPNARIRDFTAKLELRGEQLKERTCGFLRKTAAVGRLPGLSKDKLFRLALHFGNFASQEIPMNFAKHRNEIAHEKNVIAFETMAVGAWDNLPCMIVKGVSDYADGCVSEEWEQYAAATAAACAKAILEEWIAGST
ncbi:nucleoside phosphorylase domain-containing protein [Aspergillus bertholletiae]|uniref:Nucleoside phosphorylase domain-containing protein n=1 Tax=Aspergillus bertholletiae TaxID=1226010 RepID=A0A5N7AVN9_9EURO|nr:nucleoside phosphorylase domain-containing protein [Aspergillus bertholletiae]